jgi:hypothetical protein
MLARLIIRALAYAKYDDIDFAALWGGDAGRGWSAKLVRRMNSADE